jgi:hypothetical protein
MELEGEMEGWRESSREGWRDGGRPKWRDRRVGGRAEGRGL